MHDTIKRRPHCRKYNQSATCIHTDSALTPNTAKKLVRRATAAWYYNKQENTSSICRPWKSTRTPRPSLYQHWLEQFPDTNQKARTDQATTHSDIAFPFISYTRVVVEELCVSRSVGNWKDETQNQQWRAYSLTERQREVSTAGDGGRMKGTVRLLNDGNLSML